jgi:hypothetical protein
MPLAGVVVNRVHRSTVPQITAVNALAAAEALDGGEDSDSDAELTAGVLRVHAQRLTTQAAGDALVERA